MVNGKRKNEYFVDNSITLFFVVNSAMLQMKFERKWAYFGSCSESPRQRGCF
jgi:hypothetical protein